MIMGLFILHKIINSSAGFFTVLQILALNTVLLTHLCTASWPVRRSPPVPSVVLAPPSLFQSVTPNTSDDKLTG